MKIRINLALAFGLMSGCAHYITPGDRADLGHLAPEHIQEGFQREASNPFPASIVTIRVQGRNYSNHNLKRAGGVYGDGNFTVVTTREVESESDLARIQNLPAVNNVISLNRLLIPQNLETLDQLRTAASNLKADLLLIYTFDTVFFDEDRARVLSTISLGFSPNRRITATTTASALLVDTRTGFISSAYESTAKETKTASVWGRERQRIRQGWRPKEAPLKGCSTKSYPRGTALSSVEKFARRPPAKIQPFRGFT